MNIGFDAKRAYHNGTGLGHYSRSLLYSLAEYFPEHEYFLFNPKKSSPFDMKGERFRQVNPTSFLDRVFPAAWRSSRVKKDLEKYGIELYHGLSHEIPLGLDETGIPSVVTIHDLIHERYPEQYATIDVRIYSKKFRYACRHANRIIAISEQTKKDIIDFYQVPPGRIDVCYQSCNPAFAGLIPDQQKKMIREKYRLPPRFFLYVGSVIERKNLLGICRALLVPGKDPGIPLVVIGDGGSYKKKVRRFIQENRLEDRVIFLSDQDTSGGEGFKKALDFPAIYQSAIALVYPSFFEGFGIPVLEALWSGLPVITSHVSSLPEAGGDAALYIDPSDPAQIAAGMSSIYHDPDLQSSMREKGFIHAQKFSPEFCAGSVMDVYKKITGR